MPPQWGVRRRVLGVAVAILLVTLALWTWLFVSVLDATLARTARAHAVLQADQLVAALEHLTPEEALPAPSARRDGDVVVQVLDGERRVVGASSDQARSTPITSLVPSGREPAIEEVSGLPGIDSDAFVVVAENAVGVDGEPLVVAVASPVHVEEGARSRLILMGALAAGLVLGVATVLVGWALGSALRPVERLRGQLARIDGHTRGDRVDVPETGDELTRLAQTMNQLLARLEAAYAAQTVFVSDASHELRSPLSTVRASVELATADPTGQVWQEVRPTLLAEILRLQRLVDDLLTLSKYDAGGLPLRTRECDLDDLVVTAAHRTRDESGLAVAVTADPVRIVADPDRVGQILRNVLDNAARYAASTIRVAVHREGDQAVVRLDNDGPPVPAADRELVFERFLRLDATRDRDTGGAGLGLAIAADLAHAHGGTLTATESPDGWCRFELRLPAST